jgi:predicted glycosyl hydrolase (DUF1957 family)
MLRKIFGKDFKPAGFFLPEMAYSADLSRLLKKLGYKWLILDEIAYSGGTKARPKINETYLDETSGLKIVFRQREVSSAYPPDVLLPLLNKQKKIKIGEKNKLEEIILTATDAELYGLRHEDPSAELEKIVKYSELKTMTVTTYLNKLTKKPSAQGGVNKIKIHPSSWESAPGEVRANHPYALWQDKNNKIQVGLWKLAHLALSLEEKYKKDKNYYWYRWHLSRGLASCTFWWASARDFSKIFGPYAWSPDDIERGLEDIVRSVRSLNDKRTKKYKLEAEKYYLKIKKLIWEAHWKKHWPKQYE